MRKIFQKFVKGYAVLDEVDSPINGKIQVWEDWFGRKKLMVGGISQSGDLVEKVWKEGLKNSKTEKLKNILILGLGAGNAANLAAKNFPGVEIVGVEIDPEMIRLGKKYFDLSEIQNLEIIKQDALSSINNEQLTINNFDLILVDLYLGDEIPSESEKDEFIENLKKILFPGGTIIFNRLYYGKKRKKTDEFGEKLKKFFPKIEAKKVKTNKLFLCLNKGTNGTS